jgi:hypothetical protein
MHYKLTYSIYLCFYNTLTLLYKSHGYFKCHLHFSMNTLMLYIYSLKHDVPNVRSQMKYYVWRKHVIISKGNLLKWILKCACFNYDYAIIGIIIMIVNMHDHKGWIIWIESWCISLHANFMKWQWWCSQVTRKVVMFGSFYDTQTFS